MEQIITPPETQKCKCCGRELSVEKFSRNKFGRMQTCIECVSQKKKDGRKKRDELEELRRQLSEVRALRLKDFQPRELMIRLREMGYEGTLTYIERHTIDIAKVD